MFTCFYSPHLNPLGQLPLHCQATWMWLMQLLQERISVLVGIQQERELSSFV
jgi:hypothetical protein